MKKVIVIICFTCLALNICAQEYVPPSDVQVVRKLEQWSGKKFGLFMHWGIYSIPGIVESWSINSEDASWIPRDSTLHYEEYKRWYFDLNKSFNPVNFNPEQWANLARKAGMRYVVFTTKHHDGFAMFDTRQSDYKVTAPEVPFSSHPRANITKEVFDAFRKRGFMIGAYFSKPDWHNENYWWPRYATPNRNNNYDIRLHPYRWEAFKTFTYLQIEELMSDYGAIDVLWLDGGWVRPKATVNEEVLSWGAPVPDWDQDIDMPKIASMARSRQPGLIIVDRTVHGPFENYRTPEQRVPEKPLPFPWETCMTMGEAWGYVPNDMYKSARTLVHLLIDIVAKGGNFLLNVGPKPDGTFPEQAVQRLEEMGSWMAINQESIEDSYPIAPYRSGQFCFTQGKEGQVYAHYLLDEGEKNPSELLIPYPAFHTGAIRLLGQPAPLKWKKEKEGIRVYPGKGSTALRYALVFELSAKKGK